MKQGQEVLHKPDISRFDWPYSLGVPGWEAGFRTQIEDFQVDEILGFEPDGTGEHILIQLRKRDQNTRWLAAKLAEYYSLPESAVGYCGLKDRRSVSSQWFSVHLPSTEPGPPILDGAVILQMTRHRKKLRPGMHAQNQFKIVLRFSKDKIQDVNARLALIQHQGVPNYFGEQRFGRDGNNLVHVADIVARTHPRFKGARGGLYLSAARSWLFNLVLAERVKEDTWMALADGPMWGRGRPVASEQVNQFEQAILADWGQWQQALEHSGLKQERRSLALKPVDLVWHWQSLNLCIQFALPPGNYATSLLRELALLKAPKPEQSQNLVV